MLKKYAHSFIYFAKNHNPHIWQWQIAATYALCTAIILPLATLALIFALTVYDSAYAARTLPFYAVIALLSVVLYISNRWGAIKFVGHHLILLYTCLAVGIAWSVGIGAGSMVLASAAIILSGTMCGYKCALLIASFNSILFLGIRAAELYNGIHPAYVMSAKPTNFQGAILVVLLFHLLAAISGALYRLEETRRRLSATELEFARRRTLLTTTIKQQNQKLRSTEAERLQQLYRFAEVGELSTALLHDLANSLTTLTFQIDNLNTENSPAIRQARNQLKSINEILKVTRQQLKGQLEPEVFDVARETERTIKLLGPSAKRAGVTLEWARPSGGFDCFGEKVVFQQQLTNLVTNAIDSYSSVQSGTTHKVLITLKPKGQDAMLLSTVDHGRGIPPEELASVFKPFYTTKPGGMGVGLYLAKRFIESNLGGQLTAKSSHRRTVFTMTLPRHS
ncbi:MAG TPA: HAMP domain-containing sensor histidine kinase [Verrucomicrobiae bacterium]|nr:HAMP domain-containing sensor histidine kinase [Verrucomicrobiae bacterium]